MNNTGSEHRPGRIVKYSAALLALVLLAYATFLISRSWRETKSDSAEQLATIAALSENAIDVYFTQLQIGMQNLGAELDGARSKPGLDHAFALVSRFQKLHAELDNVMLIRGDGQILLTGKTPNQPDLPTLAGEPAFRKFRDELQQGTHFAIGQPVMGNIDRSWVIAARYGVTDQSGKLAYIISANLPLGLLQRYWVESITPGITALGLVRDDGYLVGRYPVPDAGSLDQTYGQPAAGAMAASLRSTDHPRQGQLELRNSAGKTTALLALRRLQHYPLTLFVEMPVSEIKAAWWRNVHAPYVATALLLACTFAFYSLKLRRRAWSVEKRREELRRNYERALRERSPNEIYMLDPDTLQITYANDYALRALGYTLEQLQEKTILALHPEWGVESFGAMIELLRLGKKESLTYEATQVRADGSTYPVEVSVQWVTSDDGGARLMAIVNDISARNQAEENIARFNA